MKKLQTLVALGAAAALLAILPGCGGETTAQTKPDLPPIPREIQVTVDGIPGPENIGIVMAEKRGFFREVGLDVWVHEPSSPVRPLPYVVVREVELAISHMPQVALARDKGAPVTAISGVVEKPTAAMIWLPKSKIGGLADLKGKTIAIPGLPFQRDFLKAVLARAGLTLDDVDVKVAEYELLPDLVKGKVDAIFGGSWNVEGAELEAVGLKPVITRVEDLGFPAYEELVLIARTDRLTKDLSPIRRFIAAMIRGVNAAVEDPEAAAKLIAYERGVPLKVARAEVEATLPLLSSSGEMSSDEAGELAGWMHEQGFIEEEPSASDLFTNDYLPSTSG